MSEEELTNWREKQNRYCLYFDGASKQAGAGGIILNLYGKENFTYEWGLGQISNNKVEAYNLLMGTRIIKKREIQNPIIIGDLAIIIEAMARNKKPSNEFMNIIFRRIRKNLEGSGDVIYRHVLRTHNQQANYFANQAVKKNEGLVWEN